LFDKAFFDLILRLKIFISHFSRLNLIATMSNDPKARYSDEELQEFKVLIEQKLVQAQEELNRTDQQIADLNENGFNQQGGDWYDDSTAHTDLEMLQRMLVRQQRYITDLRNALLRIQNKTYGICIVTGQLISKERLRLVPHATKSVDGKQIANSGREVQADSSAGTDMYIGDDSERTPTKPVSEKVRMGGKRSGKNGEDWEPDNETMEDAGYNPRKFEDDEE
jgi:RNA polymerase-binding transcription factor DksA